MITGFYAGLLALWLVFLAVSVVRMRFKYRVGLGDGGQQELMQAIRIHGNFTETVPFVLILMALMEFYRYDAWILHAFGIVLVASRLLHWWGLKHNPASSKGRFLGTIAVMALAVIGGALLVFNFIVG
jgi:uncharacterized membrane protein YecN with MAPEG domain